MRFLPLMMFIAVSIFSCRSKNSKSASLKCEDLISSTTDKVTGRNRIGLRNMQIISEDLMIDLELQYQKIAIYFIAPNKCVEKDDLVYILFRNGKRTNFMNSMDYNCDGFFKVILDKKYVDGEKLQELASTEVETIRVITSNGYVEKSFTSDQSKVFMQSISCILEK